MSKIKSGSKVKINFKHVVDYKFIKMIAEICDNCNNVVVCSHDFDGFEDGILYVKDCNNIPQNYDLIITLCDYTEFAPDIIIDVVHNAKMNVFDPFTGGVIPVVTNIKVND